MDTPEVVSIERLHSGLRVTTQFRGIYRSTLCIGHTVSSAKKAAIAQHIEYESKYFYNQEAQDV